MRVAMAIAVGVLALAPAAPARAQISIVDGRTAPVFDYDHAIREHVFIPNGQDADLDGVEDRTSIEIMRPDVDFKIPAIVAPSPYYTSAPDQFVGESIADLDADGINDRWPLWYDNYFVPRGYAVILAEMDGTAGSTGCATNGGPSDVLSIKVVVDWLNGRAPGYDPAGNSVGASWHSGRSAMIGRSYNGTLPNGVAATGVEGLTTIVPISAISSWYDYSRMGGVIGSTHYPAFLSNFVTDPSRRAHCAPIRDAMSAADGDADGTMNAFWEARNYRPDVDKVKAAVFETHCLQDDNVKPNQFSEWWAGLAANDVPRKLWLCREGHIDPFMTRRAEWMDQLHLWFDHWLFGVENGIMSQPRVDIEDTKDNWGTYADWPLPGARDVDVFLQGDTATTPGRLGGASGGATDTLRWTDLANQSEATGLNIATGTTQNNRRVFLSPVLTRDVRFSGTPRIDLFASLDKPQSNLSAMLVDYGPSTQITRSGDGISTPANAPSDCWGPSSTRVGPDGQVMDYDSCYQQPVKPTVNITATQGWRISRGILDSNNRDSLYADVPAVPGTEYEFEFPILPVDYTVPAGHRIGIVLMANFPNLERNGTTGTTITMNARRSHVSLPVVGGYRALVAAGALEPDTVAPVIGSVPDVDQTTGASGANVAFPLPAATDDADPDPVVTCDHAPGSHFPVGSTLVTCTATDASGNTAQTTFTVLLRGAYTVTGTVPATLALSLGAPATFGAFTPGVAHTYTGQTTATVTSTAGDAALTAADPGHLANGAFTLPQPLQVAITPASWTTPVSNAAVTIAFTQPVAAGDALRTGTYSRTVTFTLSTTAP